MENLRRSPARRYGVAALMVGLALLVTLQIDIVATRTPFALFFAAVMVSAWYGGRNPGLLAIVLSALVSDYFIIRPLHSLVPDRDSALQVGLFVLVALLINFLTSARQRSERLLRESEERYRPLFEGNPLPMWVYDVETLAFLAVNEAAIQCYGYSREEFLSMTIKDIRPAEDTEALLGSAAAVSCGLKVAGIWRHRKKDGGLIDVEITSHPLVFAGRPARIVLANDITERKRAEQELVHQSNLTKTITDNAVSCLFRMDREGRPTFMNPAAERVTGYTLDEISDRPLHYAIHYKRPDGSPYPMSECPIDNASAGLVAVSEQEEIFVRKDGSLFPVSYSVSPLEREGKTIGAVLEFRDITESKRAEEALRESEDRYRDLVEHSYDLIYTHDLEGRLLSVNQTAARIIGYDRDALVGSSIRYALSPEFQDHFESYIAEIQKNGIAQGLMTVLTRTGEKRVLEYTNTLRIEGVDVPIVRGMAHDVTEQRRAEAALRQSEERYRVVAETATDVIITIDENSTILFANRAAERVFGYAVSELLGGQITMLMPEYLRHVHKAAISRYSQTGQKHINWESVELPGLHKSGREIPIELSFGEFSKNGRRFFTGIARDITERKRAAEELQETEKRYRDLVENARDIIYTHDLEGNYTSINKAGKQITGYTREETLKMNLAQTVAPEHLEKARRMIAGKLAGGDETVYDLEIIAKDGRRIALEVNTRLVYKDGVPCGVQGIARDITERKRVEEMQIRRAAQVALRADVSAALAEGSVSLRRILERCAQAIVQHLDAALARIWTLNKEEDVLELQASAGLYTHIDEPHSRVPVGDSKIGLIAEKRQPYISNDVQTDPYIRDKEWAEREKLIAFAGYPLIVEDRLVGVMDMYSRQRLTEDIHEALASVADIISQGIERKRAEEALRESEEQLRQSQKMEAVGQLAGGVAHDFNNLLTVIIGYSDLLLGEPGQNESIRWKIEEIKKSGERAASLTRQLLAFSRRQVLQPKVLNLNVIVADIDKMLRRLIGEDIDLLTVLDPSLGQVKADPGQVEQVILNLAVNARDAMPQGGKLTIETANVYLDDKYARKHMSIQPGHYVMLAVSDTGCGMNAETQARMFEPFFTTKEQGKGTGLGLSTVYGIVKQSGANIYVYSEMGKGTAFKIYLPRVDAVAEGDDSGKTPAELPQGRETILIAEDEEQVRRMIRSMLEMNGYHVLEADSGEEALSIYKEHGNQIDLILTDAVMPQMGGRELAQSLETLHPGIKVLYMSGYTDDAIVRHGLLDREIAFLQKPFTPEALVRKVREVLDAEE